jgi:RIO-like serine/threonine protein kinase
MNIVKKLKGHSGSQIFLINDGSKQFIKKINNIERNWERQTALYEAGYDVPKIFNKTRNSIEMEYINGLDMKSYLNLYGTAELIKFIEQFILRVSSKFFIKDYTEVYEKKLSWLNNNNPFTFSKQELINKLPKKLPKSEYHGDFTLDNILYTTKNKFYLIDCITSEYDSWIFDLCKLRQDLKCHWFIRKDKYQSLIYNTQIIDDILLKKYEIIDNNNLLILMLLRVYPYTQEDSFDRNFIFNEVEKLWK